MSCLRGVAIGLVALVSLSSAACGDDDNQPTGCDPLLNDCPEGQVCQSQPDGTGICEDIAECDPAAPDCPEGQVCQPQPDSTGVCENLTACDLAAPACPPGQICQRQPDGDGLCLAPLPCDLSAPDCPAGQICIVQPGGEAGCTATCDPTLPDGCAANLACDLLDTGEYGCFEPVMIVGEVFDLVDVTPIGGALVAAANDTGAVVTDVAVSDATGNYDLRVPVTRDASGTILEGIFTLRAAAADYLPYPHGVRPSIPIDVTGASYTGERYELSNPTTDIGLIPLPTDEQGQAQIAGRVVTASPGGTLVVAECAAAPCPTGFADVSGDYVIFNVPNDSYTVRGYKVRLQLIPVDVTITGSVDATGVDLLESSDPLGTVSGSINIVNPGDGDLTSVVLVPESTFQQITPTFIRGEVPPGLRAPAPPAAPSIDGSFIIEGVPAGSYVVLAAFENDFLVRDPDPNIAGTQIVHITLPEAGTGATDIEIGTSFKVTGALTMIGPGADGPEGIDDSVPLEFEWVDDSSEDRYVIQVFDAFGELIWTDENLPGVSGQATVVVPYPATAPQLIPGMYYQWRAVSHRDSGGNPGPISHTEDLLGVFFIPTGVN
ncbi:MAG: hypothetical protein ABI333_10920 [bacterium]